MDRFYRVPPGTKVGVEYEREGDAIRVRLEGVTSTELRDVLVGLWLRLPDEERRDMVNELGWYADRPDEAPYLSRLVSAGPELVRDLGGMDLKALRERHREHPG